MPTLSILIPVYNEEKMVKKLLERVEKVELIANYQKEIVIVNDASTDGTKKEIEAFLHQHPENHHQFYTLPKNQGKGAAIHKAIKLAKGDYMVIQDADLEYDPEEINQLLLPVIKDEADVVYGSRFVGGNPHRVMYFMHTIINKCITLLSNLFTGLNLTDIEVCYKLFRKEIIQNINLKEKRFGFEPEVTAKIGKIKNIKVYEVGISYYGRTYSEGKKIGWKDGIRTIYAILRYNLF